MSRRVRLTLALAGVAVVVIGLLAWSIGKDRKNDAPPLDLGTLPGPTFVGWRETHPTAADVTGRFPWNREGWATRQGTYAAGEAAARSWVRPVTRADADQMCAELVTFMAGLARALPPGGSEVFGVQTNDASHDCATALHDVFGAGGVGRDEIGIAYGAVQVGGRRYTVNASVYYGHQDEPRFVVSVFSAPLDADIRDAPPPEQAALALRIAAS